MKFIRTFLGLRGVPFYPFSSKLLKKAATGSIEIMASRLQIVGNGKFQFLFARPCFSFFFFGRQPNSL